MESPPGPSAPADETSEAARAAEENADGTDQLQETREPKESDLLSEASHRFQSLLSLLGLESRRDRKLGLQDVRRISSDSIKSWAPQGPKDLPWSFLRRLLALDGSARDTTVMPGSPLGAGASGGPPAAGEEEGLAGDDDIYSFTELAVPEVPLSPLDLLCIMLLCSDSLLQQEILLKMALCQFALPLVVPDAEGGKPTFLLWAMRDVTKAWGPPTGREAGGCGEESVVLARMPTISFVRMEVSRHSKSQILNAVLGPGQPPHDTFVHRDMASGGISRDISEGLVEISWYLPSGKGPQDIFPEPLAVTNLRGDVGSHWPQFRLLTEVSSAVFILTDNVGAREYELLSSLKESPPNCYFILSPYRGRRHANLRFLGRLMSELKIDYSHVLVKVSGTDRAGFVRRLRSVVKGVVGAPGARRASLEDMARAARQLGMCVDEDGEECQRARELAERATGGSGGQGTLPRESPELPGGPRRLGVGKGLGPDGPRGPTEDPPEGQKSQLGRGPAADRTQRDPRGRLGDLQGFLKGLADPSPRGRGYFLKWLNYGPGRPTPGHLIELRAAASPPSRPNPDGLEALGQPRGASSLGAGSLLREMGRLYEAESGPGKTGKVPGARGPSAHFPRLAAELLLAGFPLGLADGDAGGLPLRWVAGVLTALQARLRGRCRLLVLSALGAQGVGKSTLLNTMFGLQFATGGCRTRGDVVQLVEVAEPFSQDLGWDFLLAIDSEGLAGRGRAAPEGGEEGDVDERDLARATLAVGLSHVVLVSVTDAADVPPAVPRAFLQMERLGHRPSCQLLLHQGPGSLSAAPRDPAEGAGPLGQWSVAAAGLEKRRLGQTPGQAAFLPTRGHTWHIPGLWHGTPPMAPVSLAYSEAALEVKRCLIENLRNGPPYPDRSISQLIERVRRLGAPGSNKATAHVGPPS
ncbi:up-regulator of cell proliferation isoform X2 [Tachyglossus aculeatus]|uniref:up-regulator of cell proliferation isoform X2 n=1 Tax=Tachyglossus aculeatus TaxID=9261 RepID=UPI0018F3BB26|nr:up-regulator of cell proliferation isoform X2 [Tachyglossus aculeatus]